MKVCFLETLVYLCLKYINRYAARVVAYSIASEKKTHTQLDNHEIC